MMSKFLASRLPKASSLRALNFRSVSSLRYGSIDLNARKQYSTHTTSEDGTSNDTAPPKMDDFIPKWRLTAHKESSAYFTGKPQYYDTLQKLDALLRQFNLQPDLMQSESSLKTMKKSEKLRLQQESIWIMKDLLQEAWHVRLSDLEYAQLITRLESLNQFCLAMAVESSQDDAIKETKHYLKEFMKPSVVAGENQSELVSSLAKGLDGMGRSYTLGFRRRVRAHCWMVKVQSDAATSQDNNFGRIMINGMDMVDVLKRMEMRGQILEPFSLTNKIGRYNVWCKLECTHDQPVGETAIAGAVANAVAQALVVHEPELEPVLSEAHLLKPDTRQRERKKPGQPSARAKFQWVKR